MRHGTRWLLVALVAGALTLVAARPAAAQACDLTIGGSFDTDATLDPASGELVIPAPATLGASLSIAAPIILDGELNDNEVFDLNGEFTVNAGATALTFVVLSGELMLNDGTQPGTLDIGAELVSSSAGPASGTLDITAEVTIVDLLPDPTPLAVSGDVSGAVTCGASSPTTNRPTSPTTASPGSSPASGSGGTSAGAGAGAGAAPAAGDDDLASTGFDPVLFGAALGALVVGVAGVVHGLGRTRIDRSFPRMRPADSVARRRA